MQPNLIFIDSYKHSHPKQYPSAMRQLSSYIEPRKGKEIVFFGLQVFLKEVLAKPITTADVDFAEKYLIPHGVPFERSRWDSIVRNYNGFLPLVINAVPEGTVSDSGNMQVQVVNHPSAPEMAWLGQAIETKLLRAIWYPSTVATISRNMKKIIRQGLVETSDLDPDQEVKFKLHDFGARGVSSCESATLGGMAHLISFLGTDTSEALPAADYFYKAGVAGFSIPAMEHSTVTSWGDSELAEKSAYSNMIELYGGDGKLYACVSDSQDIWRAVDKIWSKELKNKVISKGGTLVVRPDSGDPLTVPIQVIERLMLGFGWTVNSKGYRVLPSCIRVIQGDGIDQHSLPKIIENMKLAGLSLDNIAFGMGGGLLQHVNRDTFGYAMKASAINFDVEHPKWYDVYKNPVGGKASKAGLLDVNPEKGTYKVHPYSDGTYPPEGSSMITVYEHRRDWIQPTIKETTFEEIRKRAAIV